MNMRSKRLNKKSSINNIYILGDGGHAKEINKLIGNVGIYLNNTNIAYIQFNSRYRGHSFGIRLTDNGPILAYDSYGREFKVPSRTGDYVQYKITLP